VVERRRTLPPDLASAGESRRLLREVLTDGERQDWLDAGELAITEIVTNAALHAHTDIDVVVALHDDRLEVEVRDRSPVMPVPPGYEEEATTGRGMALVAAVTSECGVRSLGDDGKVAWFCLRADPAWEAEDVLAAWDLDDDWVVELAPGAGSVTVVLEPMPATLWLAARQHHDAVLRELVLYLAEHGHVTAALQRRLATVADEPAGRGAGARLALTVELPVEVGPDFAALRAALDTAEDLALAGRLLVHPGLPEIIAVRDWVCDQVIAQLDGGAPTPWPGGDDPAYETAVRARRDTDALDEEAAQVLSSERGVVAADDANRIVAVSRPLADLLGWHPDELVGRRVVTLVPPALREAHVAGFSRHVSTGEAHVIGRPMQLPVLRRDGTEVQCDVLLERSTLGTRRCFYLAWVDAAPG
jgi:PAS domain S-box-containing protein